MSITAQHPALWRGPQTYTRNVIKFPKTWKNIYYTTDGNKHAGDKLWRSRKAAEARARECLSLDPLHTLITATAEIYVKDVVRVVQVVARRG